MQPYPHVYVVSARSSSAELVRLSSPNLTELESAPPREFDGPGDRWSPETLLCAAVADCFVLTFRAIAAASKFNWTWLDCSVEGTLERAEGGARFTRFVTRATLTVNDGADQALAQRLLEKAEHSCLIANSLNGTRSLESRVVTQ